VAISDLTRSSVTYWHIFHESVEFAFTYKDKSHTHLQKGLQSITQQTVIGAGQSTRSDV
jgi:hypothetical protein